MSVVAEQQRRVPWRRAWGAHPFVAAMVAGHLWMALASSDLLRQIYSGCVAVALALAWAVFLRCAGPAPTTGELVEVPLPLVVIAPRRPALALLVAWVIGMVAMALLLVLELRDPPSANAKLPFLVAGLLLAVPVLLRLASGRYHLWRLELDEHGIRYRGGRHDRHLPWAEVMGVHHEERRNRMRVTGEARRSVLDVPLLVFDHPQAEIVDRVVHEWRARASR